MHNSEIGVMHGPRNKNGDLSYPGVLSNGSEGPSGSLLHPFPTDILFLICYQVSILDKSYSFKNLSLRAYFCGKRGFAVVPRRSSEAFFVGSFRECRTQEATWSQCLTNTHLGTHK